MRAYIINLDAEPRRWAAAVEAFGRIGLPVERVPAVWGANLELPMSAYDEERYRRFHGRPTNLAEVGCYLSHVEACRAFLATGDTHGLIAEDDLVLGPDFATVLEAAFRWRGSWNVLRLSGLGTGHPVRVRRLGENHVLCVHFGRLKGSGAYVVDRAAAEAFVARLLPMWLPLDHALDREWWQGLRAASVQPFPISQTDSGFKSSIQKTSRRPLERWRRWSTTYPYQAVNEVSRWLYRGVSFLRWRATEAGSVAPTGSG
jgi:glycosyl transferase family 25